MDRRDSLLLGSIYKKKSNSPCCLNDFLEIAAADGDCTTTSGNGTIANPLVFNTKISEQEGNLITCTDDGLLVSPVDFTVSVQQTVFSGDGVTLIFQIPHGLISPAPNFVLMPASIDAAGIIFGISDDTYIYVNYSVAPLFGSNNIIINWIANA